MLLTKVAVDSFRTIAARQEIDIDPKMTVLIGANESGKTNLLQAMQRLELNSDFEPEDISKSKRQRYARKKLPTVSFTFSLSKEDSQEVSRAIPGFSMQDHIAIHKESNGIKGYSMAIPKESRVKELREEQEHLRNQLMKNRSESKRLKKLINRNRSRRGNTDRQLHVGGIGAEEIKKLKSKKSRYASLIRNYEAQLAVITEDRNTLTKKLDELQGQIAKPKDKVIKVGPTQLAHILGLLPNVHYFKEIELIPETIPVAEIIGRKTPRARAVGNLLGMGEIDDLRVLNETQRRVRLILRGAADSISAKLSEAWKQEELSLELVKEGTNLVISLSERVAVTSLPQERSEGFQWFLSFLANFMPELDEKPHSRIILLDEPAIRLHPRGQKDLLRILERLSENNQVIYTSHSPFLINRNFPQRIRLLTKEPRKGTLINNKPYSNGKSRFWEPLKSAIGICLGDLFSLGEKNLVVEGISDQILITGIANKLAAIGEPFLDLDKTSIVPAMGSLSVAHMGKFAVSEGLKAVALLDSDAEGKKVMRKLKDESKLTVISIDQLKNGAITIEDLVPRSDYIDAVNSFYSKVKIADYKNYEEPDEGKPEANGIIAELKPHFEGLGYSLNKASIARELIQQLEIRQNDLPEYQAFTKLFELVSGSHPR